MKSTNPIFRDSVLSEAHALTERPMTVAKKIDNKQQLPQLT